MLRTANFGGNLNRFPNQINMQDSFNTFEYISCATLTIIGYMGTFLAIWSFVQIAMDANTSNRKYIMLFTLLNCFLLSLFISITGSFNLAISRFGISEHLWPMLAEILTFTVISSVQSMLLIIIELYLSLVSRYYLTFPQTMGLIFAELLISIVSVTWGFMLPPGDQWIVLQSSRIVIFLDFTARHPGHQLVLIWTCCLIFASISIPCFVYYRIFIEYFKNNRKNSLNRKALTDDELTIVKRSIIITSCFLIFWTPFLIKIGFESSTGIPVTPELDAMAFISVGLFFLSFALVFMNQVSCIRVRILRIFSIFKCRSSPALTSGQFISFGDIETGTALDGEMSTEETQQHIVLQLACPQNSIVSNI